MGQGDQLEIDIYPVDLPNGSRLSSQESMNLVTLLSRCRQGDELAWEAFVRQYQDMVFAIAFRLLGNLAEAEDVAQTVFMRAFERFDTVSRSAAAGGWLKTVTRNLCLNHLSRYRARWQFFSELRRAGEDGSDEAPAALSTAASAPNALEEAERAERLEEALRGLPDHQRVPLVLFHFEGMSYQQIADRLRVSVGKVKTDMHRGRERLRQELSVLNGPR